MKDLVMMVAAAVLGRQLEEYFHRAFGTPRRQHFVVILVDDRDGVCIVGSDIEDAAQLAFVLGKAAKKADDAGAEKGPVN